MRISSPPNINTKLALSNNPYRALLHDEADEEEEELLESLVRVNQEVSPNTGEDLTASSKIRNTEETASSPITISSPEKVLLSKKAQQALRKLKIAKKALTDTAIREEIEAVYGVEDATQIEDTRLEQALPSTSTKKIAEKKQDNQEQADMIIDIEEEKVEEVQNQGEKEQTDENRNTSSSSDGIHNLNNRNPTATQSTTSTAGQRNVSFSEAVNSHSLRQGNITHLPPTIRIPLNPYEKKTDDGIYHTKKTKQTKSTPKVDKNIILKKNNTRPHVHRYTLRLKTIAAKSEEDGHQIIKDALQRFLDIVLQADSKTILPPYLELDRNDKSVSDLSSAFSVSSVDSYHTLKKYFFRLSPRDDEGTSWCSIILAQAIPFSIFMEKAKYSLENNDFSLWPKATDNENTTDVGWLLYSTRAQDEERLSGLLSELIGENIGVKWKPVRSSTGSTRKKERMTPEEKTKALHVECGVDRLHEVREKLTKWYSSSSNSFPDGTKMRLVPTLTSVTSLSNRSKFASCLARQAALNAGLASAVTREISTNLLLDRKDPSTQKSFRQILMEITPRDKPGTSLFHTIDKQFKSDIIVNFQFHPDHASEAHNLIAGLVPFLKDNGHAYHLKMFNPEALQRQAKARWNQETREADSETDAELANLLAEDDDLNFTNEPTLEKPDSSELLEGNETDPIVSVQIPPVSSEHIPQIGREDDSVSTFHPGAPIILTKDSSSEEEQEETEAMRRPTGILRTPRQPEIDVISRISNSDSNTRISSLESNISAMEKAFKEEISKLQHQATLQATAQLSHGNMLTEILSMLKQTNLIREFNNIPNQSEEANHPQTEVAGDSSGVAGQG